MSDLARCLTQDLSTRARREMRRFTDWRGWRRGLFQGVIGGAANAVTIMILKPEDFNFSTGFTALWHFAAISALIGGAVYLKQHPIPDEKIAPVSQPPFPNGQP